jgi:two-component sensor histidine kinase
MALQVFRDSSDSVGMAISLNNIGNVYRYRKEYAEAISNYQQSLAIKESKGSKKSIGIAADNIGQAFLELGDFGNAEAYFKRAIDIQTATGDDDNLLMSINRLSNLYLQINDLNRAESTALVAQNERPAASQLKQRMDNNWVLFEVYNRLGKDKAASGYARKAFELKDSLYNSDAAAAIARMEAEYETKKKDKELLHAKQMQVVQVKQNRTQRGLFALLAFAGLVAVYFWRKRKNYIFRQHTLEAQQEILEVRQEALIAQLNTHFIGNTMSVINGYIRDNEKEKASEYLTLFAQLIRRVLESSHEGMVTLKDDLEIVTSYIELYKIQFAPGTLSYSLQVDDSIKADVILIPPMILQVLVENSIIHGFAKSNGGMLKLYIEKGENIIKCVIEDNGSGYAKSGSVIKKAKTSLGIKLAERLIKVSGSNKEIPIKIETVFDSKATPWTQVTVGLPYSLNS